MGGGLRGKEKIKRGINPRSRWEIILDVLRVISQEERENEGKEKKIQVMQRAYLDWWCFQRYFHFLLEQGFVEKSKSPGEGISYDLTEKGRDLLESLKEVEDILRQPA